MAVDFAGNLAWHAPVGPMMAPHGPAGSPLFYKGRVIVFQDHGGGGFIAAFDAKTGARRWWKPREMKGGGWSTPIAIRAGGRDEIVVSGMRGIYAYNPDDGEVLWKVTHPAPEVIPTPVVGHGLVFASFGRGPTLAIRPGGSGDVTATHVAWQSPKGGPHIPSTLVYGDELYMVNDQTSTATAYEAKSGAVLWQSRLGKFAHPISSSPVGVDGKVFFTNEEGETFVLKAGRTFELLHVNAINEPVLASPAMVDGTWYIRTPFHLMAIGK
jgi:outer membrane protein assembly factor BamB